MNLLGQSCIDIVSATDELVSEILQIANSKLNVIGAHHLGAKQSLSGTVDGESTDI